MDFRVKVIIPYTEVWHESTGNMPSHVIWNMVGAKVDYVITNVDRVGDCALASRRMALGFKRNRFMSDRRGHKPGEILDCNIMLVGPKMMIAECNGFDLRLSQRDVSYTAVLDLRKEYKPGQEEKARLTKFDEENSSIAVSIKETNPNPFDGADQRHHVGCSRTAVITGKYGGGVFCRLSDDTNVLCNYSPGYFDEEFYIGEEVIITIRYFDFGKKQIFGRIRSKLNKF
jgi:ribosomal protein S1